MSNRCAICGHDHDLRWHAGRVLCKRCYRALPRQRCAAAKPDGRRCMRTAIDALLCAEHQRRRAEPQTWERCPSCGIEHVAGDAHDCTPYPVDLVLEAYELAHRLAQLLQTLPDRPAAEVRRILGMEVEQ